MVSVRTTTVILLVTTIYVISSQVECHLTVGRSFQSYPDEKRTQQQRQNQVGKESGSIGLETYLEDYSPISRLFKRQRDSRSDSN